MTDEEKLYETFGELLYVIAKADGVIQDEEKNTLEDLLNNHKWAEQINWSFNYEVAKGKPIEELYKKVITVCHRIGPSPIYNEFIKGMNTIAEASNGIEKAESDKISSFSKDLIERFKRDLDNIR